VLRRPSRKQYSTVAVRADSTVQCLSNVTRPAAGQGCAACADQVWGVVACVSVVVDVVVELLGLLR
jgi:hypothetical protein